VKMKAFGIPPERPTPVPQPPPVDKGQATVGYAAVLERDPDGLPSRLHLPGPTAAPEIGLFVDGKWAGGVDASGRVRLGNDVGDVLGAVVPGSKLIAALDSAGRILALSAVCKPKRRSAVPGRLATRGTDPYRHDPNELLISAHVGRIVDVR
jgi:hypothetical protein